MENSPQDHSHESDSEEKKDSKKKKKAEVLGSFLVAPKKEDKKPEKDALEAPKKPEVKDDNVEKSEEKASKKPEEVEAPESPSLETLDEEERQFVEREYAQAYSQEDEIPATPEEVAVHEALEEFRGHIQDGMPADEAFDATVANISTRTPNVESSDGNDPIAEVIHTAKEEQKADNASEDSWRFTPQAIAAAAPFSFNLAPAQQEAALQWNGGVEVQEPVAAVEKPAVVEAAQTGLVLGGVVGFLLGRRSAKVHSESRMGEIQTKLQKQVVELGQQVKAKEEIIRHTVRSQLNAERQVQASRRFESYSPVAVQAAEKPMDMTVKKEEVIFSREQVKPVEVAPKVQKTAYKLKRQELIEISRKIRVEGTSLMKMYENRQIGEKGLRRLVDTYLKGGDVKKALKREMIQRQIDFERDPVLRDQDIRHVEDVPASNQLQSLIEKASSSLPSATGSNMYYAPKSSKNDEPESKPALPNKQLIDMALTTTIVVLSLAVLILLFRNY